MTAQKRSGFICLVGQPNVGKSTLMNRLVGHPISITADKPQTTRNRIMGIKTTDDYQAVFLDTPGIQAYEDPLNKRLLRYAVKSLQDTDLALLLVEPFRTSMTTPPDKVEMILDLLLEAKTKSALVINKIDLAQEKSVLETIKWFDSFGFFQEIFPVSALKGKGMESLQKAIPDYLEVGDCYFEEDSITDQTEGMMVAELIRQEIFRRTHREVPYSTAVRVEEMKEQENLLSIQAKIFVERDSQKGILIGRQGKMLKAIGKGARLKIESLLGTKVFLALHVAVLKDWSNNPRYLSELGYPEI